jgi:uncharacterized RDD family membrane protein YckC
VILTDAIATSLGAELREEDLSPTSTGSAVSWTSFVLGLAFVAAYEVGTTWRWGGTFGKRRGQLRVVGLDGGPVSFTMSAIRFLAWFGPWLACFLAWGATFPRDGWLSLIFFAGAFASLGLAAWAFRDRDGRGVHDRLAGTRVVAES